MRLLIFGLTAILTPLPAIAAPQAPAFERFVIDADFPGAYQVEIADINGDKKPDIVAMGGGTCAWYENPSWKKRIITGPKQTPGIISSAAADLDGDGKAEVAIAYEFEMNSPKKGKLLLAVQGATVDAPWTLKLIADVGSIHRVRWIPRGPDACPYGLVVAPIFGAEAKPPDYDQAPAEIIVYILKESADPKDWEVMRNSDKRPVLHAIEVLTGHGIGILTADNLGVRLVLPGADDNNNDFDPAELDLVPGARGPKPKRGASEVHMGRYNRKGFLATIEPWHGNQVVVYPASEDRPLPKYRERTVIDDTLDDGHALWVVDIDGDGSDEVFAGHRGKDHRVSMYRFDGKSWIKTIIDRDIAAQDLRGGDIVGDGRPDVVGVGGATHNVVWYRRK